MRFLMKRQAKHRFALALTLGLFAFATPVLAQDEQSPVDIRSDNTQFAVLSALGFNYSNNTTLSLVNTGSPDEEATIRADVAANAGSLTVGGDVYDLLQFHFHAESEHRKNGEQFPMEVHMVHRKQGGTELLVVGRWIVEGAENSAFNTLFSSLPQTAIATTQVNNFNLISLLPGDLSSFRYPGSLTTPPFTEGVSWVVLNTPLILSAGQISAFTSLFPEGDTREPQELHGRVIRTDVVGFVAAPEPGSLALLGLVGIPCVAGVVRRRN